ncbi:winged helix-turn-helix domain-containing protein [Rhizobium calliandrae]|uniref:winged helix-turn-helix domain-containing protein n=1 Tax=Rhizobium calliandrae TaxID=1312182 RepID=UPI003D80A613
MLASHNSFERARFWHQPPRQLNSRYSLRPPGGPVYLFGPFRISPGSRSLLRDGQSVDIGSRAFDLLIVLLSAPGKVFTKHDILQKVWPSLFVDEANVKVQVRRLLKNRHDDALPAVRRSG